jgi:tetrahydromethanopterin S-methyltransferase subunit G
MEHEVRVALVEQNYQQLDKRMEKVEQKMDLLHTDLLNANHSLIKVIVGSAGTIFAGVISLIVVILLN